MRATMTLAIALLSGAALAGESGMASKRKGPLAKLPSAPGAHIAKIKALGDNQWLNLGSPKADPKWGTACGRSWSANMRHAPNLGGAFLHGQGVHGYIKPNGRFMDTIWFYDLYAHCWICLYPGTNTKTFVADIKKGRLKLNDDGQLVDAEGHPVPFSSVAGHSYQDHAYAPDLGRYVFGGHVDGIGSEQHVRNQEWCKKGRALLQAQGKTDKVAGAPYYFNVFTGKFERPPAARVGRAHGGAGGSFMVDLFYLPTRKMFWQHKTGRVWLSDPAKHSWTPAGTKGPAPPGGDVGACYDSKRHRIYMLGTGSPLAGGKRNGCIYIYDVATNTWSNPPGKGATPSAYGAQGALMTYDSANDKVIVVSHRLQYGGKSNFANMAIFDPATNAWNDKLLQVPAKVNTAECWHGFYSPEVNALYIYVAGDSRPNGAMWTYRCKKAAAKKPPAAKPKKAAPKKSASAPTAPARKAPPRVRTPRQICTGWFSAARNYKKVGMLADARRCLENITRDYPKSEWARQARAELGKLETQ